MSSEAGGQQPHGLNGKEHRFLLLLLLTSCSMLPHQDGPPRRYINVSDIQNAVPKHEPRSRYGNSSSYEVRGKTYYVLPHAQGYRARGLASWYGTKFHGRRTSSGEPYDMLAMTAAHKTLPLPSYVRVLNLKNRREIIVKINDRGPFRSNRIIDLSYVAARKLGITKHGTAPVEISVVTPGYKQITMSRLERQKDCTRSISSCDEARVRPSRAVYQTVHEQRGKQATMSRLEKQRVYLQVAAFSNRLSAQNLQAQLRALLHQNIFLDSQGMTNGQQLHRVRIGPLDKDKLRKALEEKLERYGFNNTWTVVE